ncbi:MAG: molybdopterin-synthase adenylyltransferase MoeB [Alphaproteobacteria bacterium]
MDFTDTQLRRYARHIVLPEIGGAGQERLNRASVLVIGAGGLGSPLLMYLAAAGVGRLGIVDDDRVELTNLHRQIIHRESALGQSKLESARRTLADINPDTRVELHETRFSAANALDILAGYDLVADGSDNFATRYLANDAAMLSKKPLVSASVLKFEAQIATFRAFDGGGRPCYRCLYPEAPAPGTVPSCAEGGVMGAVVGVAGSLQASEVIKEILGLGESLAGHLLLYDALGTRFRKIRVPADPACPLCGANPTIRDLGHHGA